MTDDLDDLKRALAAATPPPDPARRGEILRAAQENFDAAQGSRPQPRPMSDRPWWASIGQGASTMLNTLTSRGGLAATTALVAVGFLIVTPQTRDLLTPGGGGDIVLRDQPLAVPTDTATLERRDLRTETVLADAVEMEEAAPEPVLETIAFDDADLAAAAPARPTVSVKQAPNTIIAGRSRVANEAAESLALPQAMDGSVAGYAADNATGLVIEKDVIALQPETDTEVFANEAANPVKSVTTEPVSTFSVDVDTASWSVVRSSLTSGRLPPAEAVRIEEMVNYFPYDYAAPDGGAAPFQPTVSVSATPWNPDTQLMRIGLQGELPALADRPPLNLVFLIDTSGSMQDADKLPLLKQSFRLMLAELRPEDQVAIVTYAGSAGQVLAPTAAGDRSTILTALDRLEAGGSTAGQAGLQQAYQVAEAMAEDGEVSRIILATDGDFNVGLNDPEALKTFIADKRDSGTYLSVLGFGRGNLDDATMQALAQNGNGQATYIGTLSEARKVLVDQLTGALFPIAGDVKVQVEFNPATVAEYRLIGYETRALRREDFNNDAVDAGEIGAGHQVTALYEVTPVGSPAILNDPLRYGSTEVTTTGSDSELAFLRLRWKEPGAATSRLIEAPIPVGTQAPDTDMVFAAAIAGFGQLLRGSDYIGDWSYADAIALATEGRGADDFGYRAEAITLMRLAESLTR
ncbi:MAG: DUF3520 domain-containing protein [Rhodobacteraceae bacterium]|nr:DUF3520 domain-containing protein [Paracoccaceae bacterium]